MQAADLGLRRGIRWLTPATILGGCALLVMVSPWMRDLFLREEWLGAYVLLLALTGTFTLTPFMVRLGHRWGLVDVPNARKIHRQATPRVGGLDLYMGFLCALWLGAGLQGSGLEVILTAASLLLVVGLIDDAGELSAWLRLAAQVVGAGLVVSTGTVLTLFPPGPLGQTANALITVLWIVGITNAFNFFDGMDGLATGLAILMALFMGLVAFQAQQPVLGLVALALVGAGLGFLPYNLRFNGQAVIFLGDNGSTFLGFLLACMAVKGYWADNNPIVAFSNPLLIFGVLIYDMVHITVERVATGKVRSLSDWIHYVGKDHLHHRLERVLGSRLATIGMIFGLTICLGLAAMVLRKADTVEAILLLTQASLIVIMITILEHAGRR